MGNEDKSEKINTVSIRFFFSSFFYKTKSQYTDSSFSFNVSIHRGIYSFLNGFTNDRLIRIGDDRSIDRSGSIDRVFGVAVKTGNS